MDNGRNLELECKSLYRSGSRSAAEEDETEAKEAAHKQVCIYIYIYMCVLLQFKICFGRYQSWCPKSQKNPLNRNPHIPRILVKRFHVSARNFQNYLTPPQLMCRQSPFTVHSIFVCRSSSSLCVRQWCRSQWRRTSLFCSPCCQMSSLMSATREPKWQVCVSAAHCLVCSTPPRYQNVVQ